jgi:hypothetical protein
VLLKTHNVLESGVIQRGNTKGQYRSLTQKGYTQKTYKGDIQKGNKKEHYSRANKRA